MTANPLSRVGLARLHDAMTAHVDAVASRGSSRQRRAAMRGPVPRDWAIWHWRGEAHLAQMDRRQVSG